MNFGFNEEQELLRSTARKFFENECASETVRKLMDGAEGMTPDLWRKIAEQGWTGLIFPDEHGGMGLGFVDLVVLMEEMGRSVVPGPFFSTVLLGGLAIREAGTDAQKTAWLPKISSGGSSMPIALPKLLLIFLTPSVPSSNGMVMTICGWRPACFCSSRPTSRLNF